MAKRFIRAGIISAIATLVMAVFFVTLTWAPNHVYESDLSYRTLDYDVTADTSGDLTVTQHIDVKMLERTDGDDNVKPWKQLYQQYTLRGSNLTDITDISVTNVTDGINYAQQTEPKYPDDVSDSEWDSDYANRWYIADVTAGASQPKPYTPGKDGLAINSDASKTIEIGWNIPATRKADSMKFNVTFVMHDVMTQWNDVADFQWEPFGKSNPVPIGTVTGIVHFPEGITKDDSWAWLHTERTSETSRTADGGLKFTAYNIHSGDYLDVVAAYASTPTSTGISRVRKTDRLDALKRSEAEQERQWQEGQRTAARARLALWIATVVIGVALCAWGLYASITSNKRSKYRGPIEYWRDQPGISPASAARLIDVVDKTGGTQSNRELTATLLSLAVKKALAIYPGSSDLYRGIDMSRATPVELSHMIAADPGRQRAALSTSTIVLLPAAIDAVPNREQLGLSDSEDALLNLLTVISHRVGCPVFDFNQMRLACRDWEDGYIELGKFTTACDIEYVRLDASRSRGWQWILAGVLAAVVGFGAMIANLVIGYGMVGLITGLPVFAVGLFCSMSGAMHELTATGQEIAGRCLGLKRYMQDFSNFTDRGAADLAMWDWYMVYAAAFGISERVMRELAKAYPQVSDPDWLDSNASDSMVYWTYRSHTWHDRYDYGHESGGPGGPWGPGGPGNGGGLAGQFGATPLFGGAAYAPGFSDLGSQLSSGFADITSTIHAAAPSYDSGDSGGFGGSGGSFSGGGFGGSSGGSGGGSFGGR